MRIAITGATGNLGTALLRRLGRDAGAHQLLGLTRRPPQDWPGVEWIRVDLTREASVPTLRQAFAGADAVVHLAWGFQPSHDPAYLEELGVGGTRRVLAAAAAEGVPHLVHMSSVGAYSPKVDDRPVDESWPTDGIPRSPYSHHKCAAERLLDDHEERDRLPRVTRIRPGIVGQSRAASALLRYGVPGFVPAGVIGLVPVLPLDRRLAIPMVHADDVATAVERALLDSAYGAFNLAADPPITPGMIGEALGARPVHLPWPVLRAAVDAAWRAHLMQLDPGWVDLAMRVPLLDASRARRELGWTPRPADLVLRETVAGLVRGEVGGTPVLRPRTARGRLVDLVRRGPISRRPRP